MSWRRHRVRIRTATAHDGGALDQVFAGLSPESRHRRYLAPIDRLTPSARGALTAVDGHRHVALVAEVGPQRAPVAVGLARYVVDADGHAEIAYEVVDAWQGRGIGTRMLRQLVAIARDNGVDRLYGSLLRDNEASLALLRRVLFPIEVREFGATLEFTARLVPESLDTADLLVGVRL